MVGVDRPRATHRGGQGRAANTARLFRCGPKHRTPGHFGAHSSALHDLEPTSNRLMGVEAGDPDREGVETPGRAQRGSTWEAGRVSGFASNLRGAREVPGGGT